MNSKKFAHYDFGKEANLARYGQEVPPEYDIQAITVPVASYWSQNDWLAQPTVTQFLNINIPTVTFFLFFK